jgi:hypothetical protein
MGVRRKGKTPDQRRRTVCMKILISGCWPNKLGHILT